MMPLSQDAKDINAVRSTRAGCRPRGDKNERDKKLFVAPSNLDLPDYAGHPSTHQETDRSNGFASSRPAVAPAHRWALSTDLLLPSVTKMTKRHDFLVFWFRVSKAERFGRNAFDVLAPDILRTMVFKI